MKCKSNVSLLWFSRAHRATSSMFYFGLVTVGNRVREFDHRGLDHKHNKLNSLLVLLPSADWRNLSQNRSRIVNPALTALQFWAQELAILDLKSDHSPTNASLIHIQNGFNFSSENHLINAYLEVKVNKDCLFIHTTALVLFLRGYTNSLLGPSLLKTAIMQLPE